MTNFFKSKGLVQIKSDKCIFKNESNTLYVAIHVVDGIIIGKDKCQMKEYLTKIKKGSLE